MAAGGLRARSSKEEVVGGLLVGCVLGVIAFVVTFLAFFFIKSWLDNMRAAYRPRAPQQHPWRRDHRHGRPRTTEIPVSAAANLFIPIFQDPEEDRVPRLPLQELPITPFGDVAALRGPSSRALPSIDKENYPTLRYALDRRERVLARRDLDVARALDQIQSYRDILQRSLLELSFAPSADADPDQPFFAATHMMNANTRLSMPLDSEDSSSEPDLSVLGMARAGNAGPDHQMNAMAYDDDEVLSQEQYEDTSLEDPAEEHDVAPLFDPAAVGLKEISNLGKFTVSSHKPGCGVDELRSDDLKMYWQSDGPQPHRLTIYFVKRVGIRDIRFFVDYNEDESYTPTKIVFKSGTSENHLIEFATMNLDSPVGWQQVPIAGAGGEPDGNTLVSYVLQMQILENHQNGKDTHLRGIKIYAFDADAAAGREVPAEDDDDDDGAEAMDVSDDDNEPVLAGSTDKLGDIARILAAARLESGDTGLSLPDFMREPEIR
ncbi:Anaphase-promoting complex, subunit 10/DOC domain-containingprotein [Purpureocillium lavendulum]|uniref:Anaphase-promoting complex, subunit 10/DOC domain-containingprotein n=1 Tax=Purpureocillium lavendulum TaxID=1247861 RepID=A0AB34FSB9_9HYPO|nr:Anaphase-promoting complex, subunit 10/DOC domain-containingprotein [Purpureocillium lavendulum]